MSGHAGIPLRLNWHGALVTLGSHPASRWAVPDIFMSPLRSNSGGPEHDSVAVTFCCPAALG